MVNASYQDKTVTLKGSIFDEVAQQQLIETFRAIPGVENVVFVISGQLPQLNTRIYFDLGIVNLSSSESIKLDEVLAFLQKNPGLGLKIISHSDNIGSEETNRQLAKARTQDIYQNLIRRGLKPNRLKVIVTIQPPPDIIESQSASLKRCIRFEPFGIESH